MLLHPLDFLGSEDEPEMSFFPGMTLPRAEKHELLNNLVQTLTAHFDVVPMCEHAALVERQFGLEPPKRAATPMTPRLDVPAAV